MTSFKNKVKARLRRHGVRSLDKFFGILENSPAVIATKDIEDLANDMAKEVQNYIKSQPEIWEPLKPATKKAKERKGLDPRMLIATKDYIETIGVQSIARGKGLQIVVGVPNEIHKPSGLKYNVLAKVHEFGSEARRIPARPHWQPVYRRNLLKLSQRSKDLAREIMKQLTLEINKLIDPESKAKRVK